MTMYLVLCYDKRPGKGWFAYSGALKSRDAAQEAINRADTTDVNGKPIKYKILDFWMPVTA